MRTRLSRPLSFSSLILALAMIQWSANAEAQQVGEVTLVKDGLSAMRILAGNAPEPANELQRYLHEITGADFKVEQARAGAIEFTLAASLIFHGWRWTRPRIKWLWE
jgi:hypothetical protein